MRFTTVTVVFSVVASFATGMPSTGTSSEVAVAERGIQIEQAANAILANMTVELLQEDDPNEFRIICDPPGWEAVKASCFRLREGMSYLRGLDGKGKICAAEQGKQARVSCSWGAGIFVHNTVDYYQEFRCGEIADYTEMILRECGGELCMTDTRKPGKCITGVLIKRTFGVIVSLQNC